MRCGTAATWILLAASPVASPLVAQVAQPSPADMGRPAAHELALARIGRSGLRSLLSASGNLGDLRNRAGSYRLASRLERTRSGRLEGRIAGLERTLEDPSLAPEDRARIVELRDAARAELASVPEYRASYRTGTAQAGALLPFGFFGGRPLFLRIRGRGHARWDEGDGLSVLSEGISVGPVYASDRWIVSPGLSVGRTDVDIAPFEGSSGSTSGAVQLALGRILGRGWSTAIQLAHGWSQDASRIVRPGPNGGTRVRTEGVSETASGKAEVKGRFSVGSFVDAPVSLVPRLGVFVSSTHVTASTDGVGEQGTGPLGERETYAALRAEAGATSRIGPWSPVLRLGWEHELANGASNLIDDPDALLAGIGLSWSWARGRRLSLDFDLLRGLNGRRRVSDLTLVVILDG